LKRQQLRQTIADEDSIEVRTYKEDYQGR